MAYRNVVFDLYGTLVDIRTDEERMSFWYEISEYLKQYQLFYDPEELSNWYHQVIDEQLISKDDTMYPEADLVEVFREMTDYHLDDGQIQEFATFFRKHSRMRLRLYEGIEDLLRNLKENGKHLYLLTNAQRCFTIDELDHLAIREYFDDIIISSDFGIRKPDLKLSQVLLARNGLDPEETIVVGNDYYCDVVPAIELGCRAVYIHTDISPEMDQDIRCTLAIMDGDVSLLATYLLENAE